MAKTKKLDFYYGVGRRKESQVRVRVYRGRGENTVNEKPAEKYFVGEIAKKTLARPFGATESTDKYYYSAKVSGGGMQSQLSALVLGIARALIKIKPEENRVILRKLKLLTRDSRVRQRRMVGMGGKSRRKRQSPKR